MNIGPKGSVRDVTASLAQPSPPIIPIQLLDGPVDGKFTIIKNKPGVNHDSMALKILKIFK